MSRPERTVGTCLAANHLMASPIWPRLPTCQVIWLVVMPSGQRALPSAISRMDLLNSTMA